MTQSKEDFITRMAFRLYNIVTKGGIKGWASLGTKGKEPWIQAAREAYETSEAQIDLYGPLY